MSSPFNDISSPARLFATRRSGKPRDMVSPGPDADQLRRILAAAIRVPDHGKLAPWRFVIVGDDQRETLAALLRADHLAGRPDAGRLELEAMDQFARQAPTLVVALSTPVRTSHIPLWEQELSAGAACMNLLAAAHAEGFVASWLTGPPTYSDRIRAAFGGGEGDRVAGFFFIGSPGKPLEERPVRISIRWSRTGSLDAPCCISTA
jgi:nitroreductase